MAKKKKSSKNTTSSSSSRLGLLLDRLNKSDSEEEEQNDTDDEKRSMLFVSQNQGSDRTSESECNASDGETSFSSPKEMPTVKNSNKSLDSDQNSDSGINSKDTFTQASKTSSDSNKITGKRSSKQKSDMSLDSEKNTDKSNNSKQKLDKSGVSNKETDKSITTGKSSRMELDENTKHDDESDEEEDLPSVSPLCVFTTAALSNERWSELSKEWLTQASFSYDACQDLCQRINDDINQNDCRKTDKTNKRVQHLFDASMNILAGLESSDAELHARHSPQQSPSPSEKDDSDSESETSKTTNNKTKVVFVPESDEGPFFISTIPVNDYKGSFKRNKTLGLKFGGQWLYDEEYGRLELKSIQE